MPKTVAATAIVLCFVFSSAANAQQECSDYDSLEDNLRCVFDTTVIDLRIGRINLLYYEIMGRLGVDVEAADSVETRRSWTTDANIESLLEAPVDGRLMEAGLGSLILKAAGLFGGFTGAICAVDSLSNKYTKFVNWVRRNTASPMDAALLHIENQMRDIATALGEIEAALLEIRQQLDYRVP